MVPRRRALSGAFSSLTPTLSRTDFSAKGDGAAHPREPGTDWGRKNGRSTFGYKLHVGVDAGSGLIRTACVSSARVQDVERLEALVSGDEAAVYADRGW